MLAERLLFLPGASGSLAFWRPVSDTLAHPGERVFVGWPGIGDTPPRTDVAGLDDLLRVVTDEMRGPVDLLAQSMGGLLALRAALAFPDRVRHIVLSATSGGVDVRKLGGAEWRDALRASDPEAPTWLADDRTDLTPRLGEIRAPVLLLFSDADPISPLAVGRYLASRLPRAELVVVPGGDHMFVRDRAREVAPHIARHLATAG